VVKKGRNFRDREELNLTQDAWTNFSIGCAAWREKGVKKERGSMTKKKLGCATRGKKSEPGQENPSKEYSEATNIRKGSSDI